MALRPILAICGTTGVGKSKLAIELALAISNQINNVQPSHGWRGARVINADAMQVYAGMDILTNKVPVNEQAGVDHLLMGFKKPGEQYIVGEWIRDAVDAIEETHRRNQIPVVVGGTSYWMQHLVFSGRLVSSFDEDTAQSEDSHTVGEPVTPTERLAKALSHTPSDLLGLYDNLPEVSPSANTEPEVALSLHSLLASLDPDVASRWHWKDTRKVLRSLKIIHQSGRLSSDIIQEQSKTMPEPRYRTLFFWLYAKPEVLNPRLDTRVDDMIQRGLLREVEELITLAKSSRDYSQSASDFLEETDYTLGIYQSIGYREFSTYLSTSPETDGRTREKLYADAVERMKLSTRKYAKRQVKWIRNTLLPVVNATNAMGDGPPIVPVYLLDATELGASWDRKVKDVAERITRDFLSERPLPDPRSLSQASQDLLSIPDRTIDPAAKLRARRKVTCPICTTTPANPVMIEEGSEWDAHVKTKVHRRMTGIAEGRLNKREEWMARNARSESPHRCPEVKSATGDSTPVLHV